MSGKAHRPHLGAQMYSLRDACETDLAGVLKRLANMGYHGVEFASRPAMPAAAVATLLADHGLTCPASHVSLEGLEQRLEDEIHWVRALGHQLPVIGWVPAPKSAEQAHVIACRVALAAESLARANLPLAWHNHEFEFASLDGGSTLFDHLASIDPPLTWEFDIGWLWFAGQDVASTLARFPGRASIVHVKDFADRQSRTFTPIGEGGVGYASLLPTLASTPGIDWLIIEQDAFAPGLDPFDAMERSLRFVQECLA